MEAETNYDVEEQAREMGWKPLEQFKGDPDKFVDAQTFVERGKTYIPLLKKDNDRLQGDVSRLSSEVQQLTEQLRDSISSIDALREFHAEDTARRVRAAKAAVKDEIASASEAGDHRRVAELTDQLVELGQAEKDQADVTKQTKKQTAGQAVGQGEGDRKDFSQEQWYKDWHAENPWYGKNMIKTSVANLVMQKMRAEGNRDLGKAFLDKAAQLTEQEFEEMGIGSAKSLDRVEGSVQSSGNSGGGGGPKGWGALPAEARQSCIDQIPKMVGPKKPFKTEADWKKYFVDYYRE